MIEFVLVNGKVAIEPNCLSVSAFNDIWEFDTSSKKTKASNLLTYVFHVADITQKNPLRDLPHNQKEKYSKRNAFGNQDYKFSPEEQKLIDRAIAWYVELNKKSIERLSIAMDRKIDQMTEFLESSNEIKNVSEMDSFMDTISKMKNLVAGKKEADQYIKNELEKTKVKAGRERSPLAEGLLD